MSAASEGPALRLPGRRHGATLSPVRTGQGQAMHRRHRVVGFLVPGLLLASLAACSSSSAAPTARAPLATATCTRNAATVAAVPVQGVASDWVVTSFDGTPIRAHWFPVQPASPRPAPTVLMGPGWSLPGDTDTTAPAVLGSLAIKDLWVAGFNVLTWDPRGFGQSGGRSEVDSPTVEARDVSALIDWVATRPGVQLDRPGDPAIGMVGGSYGGGIQFVTAAEDCRVDAIVPTIAWHSLVTSLDKAGTPKIGWSTLLTTLSSSDRVDPTAMAAQAAAVQGGVIPAADQAWFASRGPGALVARVHVPTLVVQGTVDTLFTLDEGVTNEAILRAHGVPTAMIWFCGGHGICLTPPGDEQLPGRATIAWLDRYVRRDKTVTTGPGFAFVDQRGTTYSAPTYPVPTGVPLTGAGQGTLTLVAGGGSGPVDTAGSTQLLAPIVGSITPARATHAVDLSVPSGARSAVVVGAPRLTLTYRGTTPPGPRPTRVFAQLVDGTTGLVLGNQVTPIDVTLDGATHTATVPLELVAYTVLPHTTVELQLVATTVAYATPLLGGTVDFSSIHLALPVASNVAPR